METKTMKKSYLIQRLQAPKGRSNPFLFGGGLKNGGISDNAMSQIVDVFSFDYMGSAEFEFGSVNESLSRVWDSKEEFIKGSVSVPWRYRRWRTGDQVSGNSVVYYLCQKDHEEEVKKRIAGWAKDENISGSTKEAVCLDRALDDRYYLGWIEIDNDFFFFIDNNMFENTSKLFEIKGK
jgi:hypothetical protein